jgi:hypothetical protein
MKKILKFCSVILLAFFVFSFWCNFANAKKVGACKACKTGGDTCATGFSCTDGQCKDSNKITFCPISSKGEPKELVNKVSGWMMVVALVVAPLMILLGGFYMLTATGDTKRTTKGKQIILWAVIGLAIILFTKTFISILKSVL